MPDAVGNPKTSGRTVIYDGTCRFCTRTADFVRERTPSDGTRFVAAQSEEGQELLAARGLTAQARETMIVIEGDGAHVRSDAALLAARGMRGPWRMLRAARIIPRPVRDAFYRLVARHRHRFVR